MDNILHDIKALLTLSFLMLWESGSNFVAGVIFLFFDLESLQLSKEYVSIVVWFIGSIAGLIYLGFRAYDMVLKAMKTRIEKRMMEQKFKQGKEENE